MSIINWIINLVVKLFLPVMVAGVTGEYIIYKRYHFMSVETRFYGEWRYPYVKILTWSIAVIAVICGFADLAYVFNISCPGFLGSVVRYLTVEHHSTFYTYFKFGRMETPVRTGLYLIYVIISFSVGVKWGIIDPIKKAQNISKTL